MAKKVLLIGSQPRRMTRLRRTYGSLKELGVDVRVMEPYTKPQGRPRIVKGIVRYLALLFQVAFLRADIYHVFNVPDVIGLPLLLKKGTVVYDVRSPWFSSIKEALGNSALSRIGGYIEWIMTRGSDLVLTANYPLAHRAHRWGARRITMIPNYPPSDFGPKRDKKEMRKILGLGNEQVILYLGKISKIEGSELLKDIILKTCKEVPSAKFLVVGDGSERPSVDIFIEQNKLGDRVVMTGWVDHEDVADYIAAADICLLPRKWDTFSPYTAPENITKATEYLAVGRVVIAPKMGGFTTAEFPIIPADPSEMADVLIEFLKNPRPINDFKPTDEKTYT
ncbi:MAG: glycosyltransferase [Candidatus Sifarchaeia archaeon]